MTCDRSMMRATPFRSRCEPRMSRACVRRRSSRRFARPLRARADPSSASFTSRCSRTTCASSSKRTTASPSRTASGASRFEPRWPSTEPDVGVRPSSSTATTRAPWCRRARFVPASSTCFSTLGSTSGPRPVSILAARGPGLTGGRRHRCCVRSALPWSRLARGWVRSAGGRAADRSTCEKEPGGRTARCHDLDSADVGVRVRRARRRAQVRCRNLARRGAAARMVSSRFAKQKRATGGAASGCS